MVACHGAEYPDSRKINSFPDTRKTISFPDSRKTNSFPDSRKLISFPDRRKINSFPDKLNSFWIDSTISPSSNPHPFLNRGRRRDSLLGTIGIYGIPFFYPPPTHTHTHLVPSLFLALIPTTAVPYPRLPHHAPPPPLPANNKNY